jgi:hypothetical protein
MFLNVDIKLSVVVEEYHIVLAKHADTFQAWQ